MISRTARLPLGALVAASVIQLAHVGTSAAAQQFPSKPVRIIVPFAAGTGPDVIARLLADHLQQRWQQTIVVENRVGASGNLAATHVAHSPSDGHTLLVSPPPPLAINRFLFKAMPYNPSDLAIVTVVASVPNVLVVKPALPVSNVTELVSFAKSAPNQLSYASTGRGGTPHLTMEWLKSATAIDLVHVPYAKGLAPALNDLLGGHVDAMFANLSDAKPHVEAGKLKALAVTSMEPVSSLPGVEPIAKTVPGMRVETWYALAAPGTISEAVANKISSDVAEILKVPSVAERFQTLSLVTIGNAPKAAAAFVDEDAKRWQGVIERIGLKPE